MRICIDATSLLLRSAGVKNYVWHWMRALRDEGTHSVSAFPLLDAAGALDHDRSVLSLAQTLPRVALLHACNIRWSRVIDTVLRDCDVFHASSLVRNLPRGKKITATLYDMTALLLPEVHTPGNIQAEKSFHDRILRRADGVIAISQSAKDDAVRLIGLDPEKVAVIYPGIDERFFRAKPAKRGKPYVLCLGTIEPRKNVGTLLDAWGRLPAPIREAFDLVLAGPMGWASNDLRARLQSPEPGIVYLGYVPEQDLPSLTAGAAVFAYPSLYEGFGFPLAQAMAAGVPCVTSRVSSLPEVAGDSALLCEPRDAAGLASALELLLGSPELRGSLGEAGRERARRFTWKNSARMSAEFFSSL